MIRALLALVLVCVSSLASAGVVNPAGGMSLSYGVGSVTMADGFAFERFMGRTLTGQGINGAVNIVEEYGMDVGGKRILVNSGRSMALGEIALAAAALGGAAWVGAQIGAPISKALGNTTVDLGPVRCVATFSGWQCDAGTATQGGGTVTGWICSGAGHTTGVFGSASSACSAWSADLGGSGCTPLNAIQFTCTNAAGLHFAVSANQQGTIQVPATCPAVIDALNPAYSKPAGGAPGADGKCPSGRYAATEPAVVAPLLAQRGNPSNDPQTWVQLVADILTKGQPITVAAPRTLSGPATSPGPTTTGTTTLPNGGTSTVTNTVTNHYNYGGDTITYNTTNVTTTVSPDGTTTETGDKPPDQTDCELHPDTVGCMKLGEPGQDKPIWKNVTVPFLPEDLGFAGACPAPVTWQVFGITLRWDYQRVCEVAPNVRLALIIMATLSAIGLIVRETSK